MTVPLADGQIFHPADSLGAVETYLVAQAGNFIHHILLILKTPALASRARHRLPIVFAVYLRKSWRSLIYFKAKKAKHCDEYRDK